MKKVLIIFIVIIGLSTEGWAQLKASTSEIFELSSIVFRLAGAEEYINNDIPEYAKDIDEYFAPYSEHSIITYINEIRENYGIGYDSVTNAAALLVINNSEIMIMRNLDLSVIEEMDDRWSVEIYAKYITLLNDFYQKSDFHKFYSAHKHLYDAAVERLDNILQEINTEWFMSFFGEKLDEPLILTSLSNGRNNYAFTTFDQGFKSGVIIGCNADNKGLPTFSSKILFTIIHELSHGFTNNLLLGIWNEIDSAAWRIFPYVEEKMCALAYGYPELMMIEWFNNLCSIMYFRENPRKDFNVESLTALHQRLGYIWMERSVEVMDHFYNHRDTFITIKDYMPDLATFINDISCDFDRIVYDFDHINPCILEVFPALGSTVSLDTEKIIIKFSEPMFVNAYGYGPAKMDDVLPIPMKNNQEVFWQDDTTFIIPVNKKKLLKGKKYGITLNRFFFQSMKAYSLSEDYIYYFNISDQ